MQLIRLNAATLERGRTAFDQYMAAVLSGPANQDTYAVGMWRATGVEALIGIIYGCIDHGIDEEQDLVHAASRISRCRTTTVRDVLAELTGEDPAQHLWHLRGGIYGNYYPVDPSTTYPRVLIAA